jgi:2-keto-4-pentenoate hydratase
MNNSNVQAAADLLDQAAQSGEWITPLRDIQPAFSIDDAYAIQQINTDRQLAKGRRIVGRKIGLTSKVVQKQLGVDQPDFGALFDDMGYGSGEVIAWGSLHQPKVEAEIAFVLKSNLDMPNPGLVDVLDAIDYALPAIEIVGSRIDKWNIRIVDTVADNASSGAYVLGTTPRSVKDINLDLCGMVMERRGEPVSTGVGKACLGNPLNAVVWLARKMVEVGQPLRAGDLVLSGALGPMVEVKPGDIVEARINGLGSVTAVFGTAQEVSA